MKEPQSIVVRDLEKIGNVCGFILQPIFKRPVAFLLAFISLAIIFATFNKAYPIWGALYGFLLFNVGYHSLRRFTDK